MTMNDLKKVEKDRKEDLTILKFTIGIVGENAGDMINNSKDTW